MTIFKSLRNAVFVLLFSFPIFEISAQKSEKYPSLLWEISGNNLEKPSYLFGTMHVSSKIAFHLGTPFFDALESVDRVALELEPEFWFDEILGGDLMGAAMNMGGYFGNGNYSSSWNEYRGNFKVDLNTQAKIQQVYKESMGSMNQLLFRFSDFSGNFEENTWLDMYIYQCAKKLKKETLGLETFEESMEMQMKSAEEGMNETKLPSSKLSYEDRSEINGKIETSYRNGDLDMLDSLNKLVAAPSFLKYILIERNKNFIAGLDTLFKQKPIFAAMGAAHLPGEEGCIEMLRALGYTVEPVQMGKRDGKQKKKLEETIVKRELRPFKSGDGQVAFESPFNTYSFPFEKNSTRYVSMDIANGLTFIVTRTLSNNGLNNQSPQQLMDAMEHVMYETIPGEIISTKKINQNGIIGFDIVNKTRRGDYNRSQILFLKNEVIVARLGGSGEKVKEGAGDYYFSSLAIVEAKDHNWEKITTSDGSLSFLGKGKLTTYSFDPKNLNKTELFYTSSDDDGNVFMSFRTRIHDKDYLEEDQYELFKIEDAFRHDFKLDTVEGSKLYDLENRRLTVKYTNKKGETSSAMFAINDIGYHVFYVISKSEDIIKKHFAGITLSKPKVAEYFDYEDSTLFFKSKISWEIEKNGLESMMGYFKGLGRGKKFLNLNNQYIQSSILNSPHSPDWLEIEYRRKGIYEFTDDKEGYEEDVDDNLTLGNDLVIEEKKFDWDGNNYTAQYILSDTLSSRNYKINLFFKNRGVHMVKTSYEKSQGPSDFYENFISNFETLDDSLNTTSYFETTESEFMKNIMSTDSVYFESAHNKVGSMYYLYGADNAYSNYKKLSTYAPPLADEDQKKRYSKNLNSYMYMDKSQKNIDSLKILFLESSDSAYFQQQILENLLFMKTKEGVLAAKELLLKEAPLGGSIYPFELTYKLYDTLELAKLLFPEILELTNYEEYKYCWTNLMSTLLDSNIIKKEVYKSYVPYLTREAKAEFRRLSSTEENSAKDNYEYDYGYDDYEENFMDDYWNLLYPYKSDEKVNEIFTSANDTKKRLVAEDYALFLNKKEVKVDDILCEKAMFKDDPLTNWYILRDIDRLDYVSDTFNLEMAYIESSIKDNWGGYDYDNPKIDSITLIKTQSDQIRSRNYTTYFYKYRKVANEKSKWFYHVSMIKPSDAEQGLFTYDSKKIVIDEDKTAEEQFEELRLKLIDDNRNNNYLNAYYDEYDYDYDYGYEDYYDY